MIYVKDYWPANDDLTWRLKILRSHQHVFIALSLHMPVPNGQENTFNYADLHYSP